MAFFWIKYVLHCFRILPEERHVEFLDTFDTFGCKYQVLDVSVMFSFPSSGRHLIYRVNGMVSMRPLLDDEEVFTPNGFVQFIRRLGYRVTPPSDNMKSTV